MKIAIYPGSFNPWHDGHVDVLKKALKLFDCIVVCRMQNPDKPLPNMDIYPIEKAIFKDKDIEADRVSVMNYDGLLVDFSKTNDIKITAVVKGLRNGMDMEYEKVQQYWNEDLGLTISTVYILSDRKLVHVSSSAIRAIHKIKDK